MTAMRRGGITRNKSIVICGDDNVYGAVRDIIEELEGEADVYCPRFQHDPRAFRPYVYFPQIRNGRDSGRHRSLPNISYADEVVVVVDESLSVGEHLRSEIVSAAMQGIPIRLRLAVAVSR